MDAVGLDSQLRRVSRSDPGRHAGDGQPDVAARPAPPAARRDRRPSGAVRDDLLDPEPPLRRRACGGSATARTRRRSSTCTSSPTPCTRASRPSTSPAASPARTRGSAPTCCGAPARCSRSTAAGRGTSCRRGRPAARRCGRARAAVTADELRAVFDATEPLTIGLEEEVMLLDPETLDLAPVAARSSSAAAGLKLELPASQLEVATAPAAQRRRRDRRSSPPAAASSPSWPAAGAAGGRGRAPVRRAARGAQRRRALRRDPRRLRRRRPRPARVRAAGARRARAPPTRTLAVYNALRGHLPELAALAANAPFHAGRDTGLASVRPLIGGLLPRQGVPPVIPSWEAFAEMLRWIGDPRQWWWELRPHPTFGTLELRVCDAQTTVARGRGGRGVRARAGGVAGGAVRGRRGAGRAGVLADRREPLGGVPARARRRVRRPRRRGSGGRCASVLRDAAWTQVAARLRGELAALVERNGAMRQREVGARARGAAGSRTASYRVLSGPRRRRALEPDHVVRPVAERPHARLAAPAQRDRLAPRSTISLPS